MIIIMGGLPKSGKTEVVKAISEDLNAMIISPEDLCSDVPEDQRMDANIEAWKISDECLNKLIKDTSDEQIIIYDTCGSNAEQLKNIYKNASKNNHSKVYIFVHSKMSKCIDRCDIKPDIFETYRDRFKNILVKVKNYSDKFFVVHNDGSIKDLKGKASEIINVIV